jgi:hypothetical protein
MPAILGQMIKRDIPILAVINSFVMVSLIVKNLMIARPHLPSGSGKD